MLVVEIWTVFLWHEEEGDSGQSYANISMEQSNRPVPHSVIPMRDLSERSFILSNGDIQQRGSGAVTAAIARLI